MLGNNLKELLKNFQILDEKYTEVNHVEKLEIIKKVNFTLKSLKFTHSPDPVEFLIGLFQF